MLKLDKTFCVKNNHKLLSFICSDYNDNLSTIKSNIHQNDQLKLWNHKIKAIGANNIIESFNKLNQTKLGTLFSQLKINMVSGNKGIIDLNQDKNTVEKMLIQMTIIMNEQEVNIFEEFLNNYYNRKLENSSLMFFEDIDNKLQLYIINLEHNYLNVCKYSYTKFNINPYQFLYNLNSEDLKKILIEGSDKYGLLDYFYYYTDLLLEQSINKTKEE